MSIFLFPPSWEELERRLRSRGTDDDEVIATRLRNARDEVGYADRYRYWIVNDDLDRGVGRMRAMIHGRGMPPRGLSQPPLAARDTDPSG